MEIKGKHLVAFKANIHLSNQHNLDVFVKIIK